MPPAVSTALAIADGVRCGVEVDGVAPFRVEWNHPPAGWESIVAWSCRARSFLREAMAPVPWSEAGAHLRYDVIVRQGRERAQVIAALDALAPRDAVSGAVEGPVVLRGLTRMHAQVARRRLVDAGAEVGLELRSFEAASSDRV